MTTTTTRLGEAAGAASETVKETAKEAASYVSDATERARDQLGTTERRVRELVEEYPLSCFLGAVLTGYLIGRVATRL